MRPILRNFDSQAEYIHAMIAWHRGQNEFSIRQQAPLYGLSPSLVSQVAAGKRQLTIERVEAFAEMLELRLDETKYLEEWVRESRQPAKTQVSERRNIRTRLEPQNHLLSSWVHPYVKDLCRLKGFIEDPQHIEKMTGRLLPADRVKKSLYYLQTHGFIKRDLKGDLVLNEALVVSSEGVPVSAIRRFHKKALEISKRAIDRFHPLEREANTLLMNLNKDQVLELREKITRFRDELEDFAESCEDGEDGLYQVVLHMTKIYES